MLAVLVLLGLFNAVHAAGQEVVLQDFDVSHSGFSFRLGKVTKSQGEVTAETDFMLDLPHGIGTNNTKLSKKFTGQAGVVDMGEMSLAEIKEAPKTGYQPALSPSDIKVGHSYCFLTADGQHYGKIEVLGFDEENETLTFIWQYQAEKTNQF